MGRKLDKETKQSFFPTLNQNKTITKTKSTSNVRYI